MVSTSPPPAYDAAPDTQVGELGVTLVAQPSSHELLVSLTPPTQPQSIGDKMAGRRAPLDLCLVIDISRSMDKEAPIPGEQDKDETTGLSVLDVVKHATRTILESMDDDDQIAIVTFSSSAEVVAHLTPVTEENRARIWSMVDGLRTKRVTNLWDGLKTGMNLITQVGQGSAGSSIAPRSSSSIPPASRTTTASPTPSSLLSSIGIGEKKQAPDSSSSDRPLPNPPRQRLSAVFVLTDGQPNVEPPRGHIPMLKRYLDALPPDSPKFTISTFGFGYILDSQLLDGIANLGQGTYGFIPDSGMIGTVFIHALANLMTTWARGCTLDIELTGKNASTQTQVEVLGALPVKFPSGVASIQVGDIQYGQSRDIVVRLPAPYFTFESDYTANVTVAYSPHTLDTNAPALQATRVLDRSHEVGQSVALQHEVYRLYFVQQISKLFKDRRQGKDIPNGSQLRQTLANHTNNPLLTDHEPSVALSSDITSQVILGLEPKNWSRWGKHYIPALARSHQRQQCSNFKDPGLQFYGIDSPLFISTRDNIDGKFDSLPPPNPSLVDRYLHHSQTPVVTLSLAAHRSQGQPQAETRLRRSTQVTQPQAPLDPPEPPRPRSSSRIGSGLSFTMSGRLRSFTAVSSMSFYNSRSAPCFAGWCLVDVGNGQKVKVSDLCQGTMVATPAGNSRVAAILRTACPSGVADLCFLGALAVTPWHPIQHSGSWVFPANVCKPSSVPCDYVYSVLLEPSTDPNAHALCIGGVWCVTLGHGCTDSVRAHPFLGDYAGVVRSLSRMKGYYSEHGVADGGGVVRDNQTGLVCGFRGPEVEYVHDRETCDSLQWVACEV